MAEVEGGDRSSSLDTVVAVLIAVSTLVGAGLAWRSSVAGDAAGDADYAGLRSVVNVEETRATNAVNAYERQLIVRALQAAGGVQKRAAELLQVKPTTLHEMMKRLSISAETLNS